MCFRVGNFALISHRNNGSVAGKDHPPTISLLWNLWLFGRSIHLFWGKFNPG
jgi:hypothetical protein